MSQPKTITPEMLTAHTTWVRRLALQLVDDPHLADDLAQSACVAAIQRPPHDANLRAWFERVLRNLLRQGRRSESRRRTRERRFASAESAPSSAELAARLQMHRRVVEAVQELGDPYREVILLRYFQDLPPREIARLREAPVATVNSQLARGLSRLRQRLDERHGGDRETWCAPMASWLLNRHTGPLMAAGGYVMKSKGLWVVAAASLVGLWALTQVVWSGEPATPAENQAADGMRSILPAAASGTDVPDGEPLRREVDIPTSETAPATPSFHGRVVDISGSALSGIAVRWRTGPEDEGATTDELGGFSMPVPDGTRQVVVDDPNLATVLAAHVGADVQRYEGEPVVVAAPALAVSGRVVDEAGRPVLGTPVSSRLPGDLETRLPFALDVSHHLPWNTLTDDEGRFELDLAMVDGASISARKPGFLPLQVPQPTTSPVELLLTLERPRPSADSLQGQVLDPGGMPVPEALVSLGRAQALTDAGGLFVLPLRTAYGRTDLWAMKPGYLPAQTELAEKPEPSDFVYLQLQGMSRSISGLVLDSAGAPMAGARVWAEDATAFILEDGIGAVEGYLADKPSENDLRRGMEGEVERATVDELWRNSSNALWPWVETDIQGRFELGGLLDKPYRVGAMRPGVLSRVVAGPFPAGTTDARIAFPADAVLPLVAGQVVGADGTPVEDVIVTPMVWPLMVSYVDARADFITGVRQVRPSARTDAEGRFEFRNLGRYVQFDFEGDGILPQRYGDHQDDLLAGRWPVDALRIEVSRRIRLRIELEDANRADSFRAFDRQGVRSLLHKFSGNLQGRLVSLPITDGRSEVCGVSEGTTTIAFYSGDQEVGRTQVDLVPGEINVVRW